MAANHAIECQKSLRDQEVAAKKAVSVEDKVATKVAVKKLKQETAKAFEDAFEAIEFLLTDPGDVEGEVRCIEALRLLSGGSPIKESRGVSVLIAIRAGAPWETIRTIIDAGVLGRGKTCTLPAGRYEHLSRGKGWARMGRGKDAVWGQKAAGGYVVGPGKWTVGSNDGFNHSSETKWEVSHIQVGDETWTLGV